MTFFLVSFLEAVKENWKLDAKALFFFNEDDLKLKWEVIIIISLIYFYINTVSSDF